MRFQLGGGLNFGFGGGLRLSRRLSFGFDVVFRLGAGSRSTPDARSAPASSSAPGAGSTPGSRSAVGIGSTPRSRSACGPTSAASIPDAAKRADASLAASGISARSAQPSSTAAAAAPATTSIANPRDANSCTTSHQCVGLPPWRSGATSTMPSTPPRREVSWSSRRMRRDGVTSAIGVRAISARSFASSQRRTASGEAPRPANMSSSAVTPATVMFGAGSDTAGASTRATRRRRDAASATPSMTTLPLSAFIRPEAMSPSTVGRCSVSARASTAFPDEKPSDMSGSASPRGPFDTA